MAYSETKRETAQALFAAAIQMMKENSFTVPADKAPTEMAIAMLVEREIKSNCLLAQKVAHEILEEVNEHTLAKAFNSIAEVHNENFDMEEA